MSFQYILVGVIIAAAVVYIARSVYKSMQGKSCESGACGCEKKPLRKA